MVAGRRHPHIARSHVARSYVARSHVASNAPSAASVPPRFPGPVVRVSSRESARRLRWLGLGLAANVGLACSEDGIVTLGTGGPVLAFAGGGERVNNVNLEASEEYDPTLTDDLLEVFFISDRQGGMGGRDVWHAERRSRTDGFDAPVLLVAASSFQEEASPVVSGDGLTLWFGSRREPSVGAMDVWRTTRPTRGEPWAAPENVASLNSALDDLPRPLGAGELVMPFASSRADGVYQTFLAERPSTGADFASITPLDYLWAAGSSMDDAQLTRDGRVLFFRRAGLGEPGDLFISWRASDADAFAPPVPLDAVNSPDDDRDPFLSADEIRFFFSSDRRDGVTLDIYATNIEVPSFD
jgi:hypothetical protein